MASPPQARYVGRENLSKTIGTVQVRRWRNRLPYCRLWKVICDQQYSDEHEDRPYYWDIWRFRRPPLAFCLPRNPWREGVSPEEQRKNFRGVDIIPPEQRRGADPQRVTGPSFHRPSRDMAYLRGFAAFINSAKRPERPGAFASGRCLPSIAEGYGLSSFYHAAWHRPAPA